MHGVMDNLQNYTSFCYHGIWKNNTFNSLFSQYLTKRNSNQPWSDIFIETQFIIAKFILIFIQHFQQQHSYNIHYLTCESRECPTSSQEEAEDTEPPMLLGSSILHDPSVDCLFKKSQGRFPTSVLSEPIPPVLLHH